MLNFGTSGHILSSTQKIAPSIQRIDRDIDPYVYNQTLQGSSEQTPGTTTNQIQYNPRLSVQHVQQPTGQSQNQMINFGTSGHILSSAQKIAPSVQRIRRDIDPYVYNQRL